MYTPGSAGHIKVSVKEDTRGLGAASKALDEPTGLDAFKGLLGRLNGKPDAQLEEEERAREDVRLARYAASKWQTVQFVSGGLLTQEKNETPRPTRSRKDTGNDSELDDAPAAKKRKKKNENSESSTGDTQATKKPSKKRKSKGTHAERPDEEATKSERKKEKKAKKRKHKEESAPDEHTASQSESGTGSSKQKQSPLPAVSRERRPMGRHTFRGRHMDAKKKALLDDKSLSEVFILRYHGVRTRSNWKLIRLDLYGRRLGLLQTCQLIERRLRTGYLPITPNEVDDWIRLLRH